MNKVVYGCGDDGWFKMDGLKSDLDVVVELIVSEVKMGNWWVVVESLDKGIGVDRIIDEMRKGIKDRMEWLGFEDDMGFGVDYMMEFVSMNILSDGFCLFVEMIVC